MFAQTLRQVFFPPGALDRSLVVALSDLPDDDADVITVLAKRECQTP
jgi:hypothetical protein